MLYLMIFYLIENVISMAFFLFCSQSRKGLSMDDMGNTLGNLRLGMLVMALFSSHLTLHVCFSLQCGCVRDWLLAKVFFGYL